MISILGNAFGLSNPCTIEIKLNKVDSRKMATLKDAKGTPYKVPIFFVSHETKIKIIGW